MSNITEFYKDKTIYQYGFDLPTYMYKEMKENDLKKCSSPVFAGIRVTSVCNMNCPHCFANSEPLIMTFVQYKKIIDKLIDGQIYKITLTGGEPFLNPELFKIIKYTKEKGLVVSLHTNGTLVNNEHIILLKSLLDENDWIQISLDGCSYDSYYNTRRNTMFETIINNIRLLCENGYNVKINTVVTNKNYKLLANIYELSTQLGIKQISFSPLFGSINEEDEIYYPHDNLIFQEIQKVISAYDRHEGKVGIDVDGIAVPWGCKELNGLESGRLICPAGKTSIEVDVNGDVYPCPFLFEKDYKMGNLLDSSLEGIWNSDSISELVSENWVDDPLCADCIHKELCLGGCYAVAKHSNHFCDVRCEKVRRKYEDASFK